LSLPVAPVRSGKSSSASSRLTDSARAAGWFAASAAQLAGQCHDVVAEVFWELNTAVR